MYIVCRGVPFLVRLHSSAFDDDAPVVHGAHNSSTVVDPSPEISASMFFLSQVRLVRHHLVFARGSSFAPSVAQPLESQSIWSHCIRTHAPETQGGQRWTCGRMRFSLCVSVASAKSQHARYASPATRACAMVSSPLVPRCVHRFCR
jgi:hypothetical protein